MNGCDAFTEQGFAFSRIADDSLIEEMRFVSERVLEHASEQSGMSVGRLLSLITALGAENPQVKQLGRLAGASLHKLTSEIVEIRPEPIDVSLFVLSRACGDRTHAHQDLAYKWNQSVERRYGVTSWVALDSCGPARGGLSLLPGSHFPPLEVRQDFLSRKHVERAESLSWRRLADTPELQPGDAIVFDSSTWHAAEPYSRTGFRRALAIRWSTLAGLEQARPIPVPPSKLNEFGMDTAGQLLCSAIRHAFPISEKSCLTSDTLGYIEWLRSEAGTGQLSLTMEAWRVVEDLADALKLLRTLYARPATRVWRNVRDILLPELHGIASQYELGGVS